MDQERTSGRWTWYLLMWLPPLGMAIIFLAVMLTLAGGWEPFLFVFAVITTATALVGRRFPRRAGPITVLIVMVLLILMNVESLIEDLGHPESFMNFAVFGVAVLVLALSAIVGSVATLVSASDGAATAFAYIAVGVIVVAVAVSAIAALSLEDDTAAGGDLLVTAEDVEFSPVALTGSGTIGVFVENKDPFRHTFTIEDLGVDIELPASTDRRVEFTGEPGEYEFTCKVVGHEDMKGTLTITG